MGPGESIVCTFQAHSHLTFNLIVFYRPPGGQNIDHLVDLLQDQNLIYPNILVRDFNLPNIVWLNGKGEVKVPSSM